MPIGDGLRSVYVISNPDVDNEGQVVGWFVSLTDITEKKFLEREVLQAGEAEQQRLAANLHDGICQDLTAISATAKGLQRQLEKQSHPLAPDMGKIASSIAKATAQARQIAHGMNPVVVGGDGLTGALRELVSKTAEDCQVSCSFKCASPSLNLDPVESTQLYLIAQEAIRNAARHSGATRIQVELSENASERSLVVRDNGRGLPANADQGSGLGLRGMRFRAGLLGGRLTIGNRQSGGSEILCWIPKRMTSERELRAKAN
jgi:two-component system, LuxR family, sensor kinase FixL